MFFLICSFFSRRYSQLSRHVIVNPPENRQFEALRFTRGNPKYLDDHFQIWLTFEHAVKFA